MSQSLQQSEQASKQNSSGKTKQQKSQLDHAEMRKGYANMLERNSQPAQMMAEEGEPLQEKGMGNSVQLNEQSIESNEKSANHQEDKENNKDGFSSAEKAARAFGRNYNKESIDINLEYAALIYCVESDDGKKKYYYDKPKIGKKPDKVNFPLLTKGSIKERKIIAYVHTHGEHDPNKDNTIGSKALGAQSNNKTDWNNTFSYNYKNIEKKSVQDVEFANNMGIDGYLIGPDGVLRKYDRKDNIEKEREAKKIYKEKNNNKLDGFFYDPIFENLQSISNRDEKDDKYKSKMFLDIAKEKKRLKPSRPDDKEFIKRYEKEEVVRSKNRSNNRKENLKRIDEEFG